MLTAEMVVALLLLFALSVATREAPLFLLTLALLVAAALSRLWERFALERIEYRRHFSRAQVAFGEQVELEIEVVNRKLLPLSWAVLTGRHDVGAQIHGIAVRRIGPPEGWRDMPELSPVAVVTA